MNLPYYESVSQYSSIISWSIPILLDFSRGLSRKAGWITLLSILSGLASWSAIMIQLYMGIWNDEYLRASGESPLNGLGANGAANAFASLLGWIPGVLTFFLSMFLTYFIIKWVPKKSKKREPQS